MELKIKNFNIDSYLPKFLEGGEMAPPAEEGIDAGAPPAEAAPAGGGDPMQELLMACQQALQTQDCNLMALVCQALLQMAGGGGEAAPTEPQGEPVYKRGGKLSRRLK